MCESLEKDENDDTKVKGQSSAFFFLVDYKNIKIWGAATLKSATLRVDGCLTDSTSPKILTTTMLCYVSYVYAES